jgi:hypothetical protein
VFLHEASTRLWIRCRQLLANLLPAGEQLQKTLAQVDALVGVPPVNIQLPLQRIAAKVIEAGRFPG